MIVTGKLANGNCIDVREEPDGAISAGLRLNAESLANGWTNQCPLFLCRVEDGVPRTVRLEVRWPEYDPEMVTGGHDYGGNHSFVEAAPFCVFTSSDSMNWTHRSDAWRDGWRVKLDVECGREPTYVAINLPYTAASYRALCERIDANDHVTRTVIGRSYAGMDIEAFSVRDDSVGPQRKRAVYLQSLQHPSEVTGPRVIDGILRLLATDDELAVRFRERCVLHAVPVVAPDAWYEGLDYHVSGVNLNRDWVDRSQPETRAVHGFLEEISGSSDDLKLALDLHNGWHSLDHHGSAITVFPPETVGEDLVADQRAFIAAVTDRCDHIPADAIWENGFKPHNFAGHVWQTYGIQAHTVEFSRFSLWDRAVGRSVALTQDRVERLSRQYLGVILDWLTREDS